MYMYTCINLNFEKFTLKSGFVLQGHIESTYYYYYYYYYYCYISAAVIYTFYIHFTQGGMGSALLSDPEKIEAVSLSFF